MSVRITRIAFVYHRVTDIVRARDFYERLLGMKLALEYEGAPGKWWIEYDVDGVAFAITNVGAPNGNGGAVPAFEVADVEAAAKALRGAGAMFVEPLTEYPRCRSFTSHGSRWKSDWFPSAKIRGRDPKICSKPSRGGGTLHSRTKRPDRCSSPAGSSRSHSPLFTDGLLCRHRK